MSNADFNTYVSLKLTKLQMECLLICVKAASGSTFTHQETRQTLQQFARFIWDKVKNDPDFSHFNLESMSEF